jgi:hypothetical protein
MPLRGMRCRLPSGLSPHLEAQHPGSLGVNDQFELG